MAGSSAAGHRRFSCPGSRWRLTATRVQDLPIRNSVITPMKPPQARLFRQGAPSGSVCCVESGHVYEPSEAGSGHRLRPFRVEVHPPHQDRV